eukprot:scaffold2276_cov160-Amphora_coffeaeformis.AAC.2
MAWLTRRLPPPLSLFWTVAAMKMLDKDVVKEYRTAMETFPHVLQSETSFDSFLRTVNVFVNEFVNVFVKHHNVAKAAHRLAMYWKFRKEIFDERWLLPMTRLETVV